MESLINPRKVCSINVYKRFTRKWITTELRYKPGETYKDNKYFFGLFSTVKVASDYIYVNFSDLSFKLKTREEIINDYGKEEFDKKFEIGSDGIIYYKPHVIINIDDSYSSKNNSKVKYFNSDQELIDWINTELDKEDLKLKTKWINV